jgi:hypothetical protein
VDEDEESQEYCEVKKPNFKTFYSDMRINGGDGEREHA